KISAKSKNGVLEITIPKQEKVQPRKIAVEG
ncbi:MAG TPA: Hsp20 family protein, partial [Chromatiales bacterium]|nr:Hsp20 family protein [Chromatiales bacterium]